MNFETMMKRSTGIAIVTAIIASFTLSAQTNSLPNLPGIATDTNTLWVLGISFITPLIVTGIKNVAPKVPGWILPASTPLIGIALGLLLQWLGKANLSWIDMAKAGALAVMIRETWDQATTPTPPPSA